MLSETTGPAGEKKDKPKGTKKERLPRVQLRKIEMKAEGLVVECTFDTYKSNRITFRFDVKIDDPKDIADSMVRFFHFFRVDSLNTPVSHY